MSQHDDQLVMGGHCNLFHVPEPHPPLNAADILRDSQNAATNQMVRDAMHPGPRLDPSRIFRGMYDDGPNHHQSSEREPEHLFDEGGIRIPGGGRFMPYTPWNGPEEPTTYGGHVIAPDEYGPPTEEVGR